MKNDPNQANQMLAAMLEQMRGQIAEVCQQLAHARAVADINAKAAQAYQAEVAELRDKLAALKGAPANGSTVAAPPAAH